MDTRRWRTAPGWKAAATAVWIGCVLVGAWAAWLIGGLEKSEMQALTSGFSADLAERIDDVLAVPVGIGVVAGLVDGDSGAVQRWLDRASSTWGRMDGVEQILYVPADDTLPPASWSRQGGAGDEALAELAAKATGGIVVAPPEVAGAPHLIALPLADGVAVTAVDIDAVVMAAAAESGGLIDGALLLDGDPHGSTPPDSGVVTSEVAATFGLGSSIAVWPGPRSSGSAAVPALVVFVVVGTILAGLMSMLGANVGNRLDAATKRTRLAEDVAKSKDRFIASVSHELRTPLTAIAGYSRILADDPLGFDEHDRRHMIETIAAQSLDMSYLIEDLLVAGRSEAGTITIRSEPVDLMKEVGSVVVQMADLHDRRVDLVGDQVFAMADPLRVRQIVRNLIVNAITHGGRRVYVELIEHRGSAVIGVFDDGPGVAASSPEEVFRPYITPVEAPTTPSPVGVGLSVSRDLARLMGGDVVYRRARGWTCFRLEVPIAAGLHIAV
jgi:signal transduction histidine kinase